MDESWAFLCLQGKHACFQRRPLAHGDADPRRQPLPRGISGALGACPRGILSTTASAWSALGSHGAMLALSSDGKQLILVGRDRRRSRHRSRKGWTIHARRDPKGPRLFYGHGWPVCRQCRSNCRRWPGMTGMPAMQEQLPAMARDGRYAGNTGAIAGDGHGWPVCRQCRSSCRRWPWMVGRPAMQEQLPAMAMDGR